MAWLYLLFAGCFEIGFTTALRYVNGFTRVVPTVVFIACASLSFYFLNKSLVSVPLGTAYAIWTGIGAAGTVIVGIVYYHEPFEAVRLLFLTLLIGSIAGLKIVSSH